MPDRPGDVYSRLDEIDDPTLRSIADVLELRGRHPRQVEIREAYLGLLGDLGGQQVLDLGCGTGVVARELARRVGPSGRVVGVDPTPTFVEVADELRRDAGFTNLRFEVGDGRGLRLPSADFDTVLAVTVLSHLPDRERVLRELRRVARFRGHVLIVDGDYAANQLAHPDRTLTDRIVAAWLETTVDDPYLCRRLVPMVRAAGLEVVEVRGHVHAEAGQVDEASSYIWQWSLFAARQALSAGAISDAEAEAWLDKLGELNVTGQLFGSVNYVSVLARRP